MSDTRYNGIDIARAILAVIVMLIHVNPLGEDYANYIYPIARAAVPLFFVISSFFFFMKIDYIWKDDRERIKNFILRNIKLYIFWFIVLFPITLFRRHYLSYSFPNIIFVIIKDFFFKSTFGASWYIIALIAGMLIIYGIKKLGGIKVAIIIAAGSYVLCCICSNYYNLFIGVEWFTKIIEYSPWTIYNSFFVGLIWIVIGMIFAEQKKNGGIFFRLDTKTKGIALIVSVILLYCEQGVIYVFDLSYANDCYIMLIPVVCVSFLALESWKVKNNNLTMPLRKYSVITYCSHISLGYVWRYFFLLIFNISASWIVFTFTLFSSIVLSLTIFKLEKRKYLKWLKYSH